MSNRNSPIQPKEGWLPKPDEELVLLLRHCSSNQRLHKLTYSGKIEAKHIASIFCSQLLSKKFTTPLHVQIFHSPIPQATQSAKLLAQCLKKNQALRKIKISKPTSSKLLNTTGSVGELLRRGISDQHVIQYWLTQPLPRRTRTPIEAAQQLKKFLRQRQQKRVHTQKPTPPRVTIAITHRSAIAALLFVATGKTPRQFRLRWNHTAHLPPVLIRITDTPKLIFKGKTWPIRLS